MEVYVDDMIGKSKKKKDHITHLKEPFNLLWKYNIKLNLEKCTFEVVSGNFIGHVVTK